MKITLTLAIAAALVTGALQARTWTSSDGSKSFKGEYVSHTEEFVKVTIGFKDVRFKISLLSEDDRKWLEEKKAEAAKPVEEKNDGDPGKIGEKLADKLSILAGDAFEQHSQDKQPEYYLVYFTASW